MPDGADRWATYLWSLLVSARRDPLVELAENAIVGLFAFGFIVFLLCMAIAIRHGGKKKSHEKAKERKHIETSGLERFLQWIVPPNDPWIVGAITVSFQWLAHALIWGTTGSGKSTFVRMRILRPPLGLVGLIIKFIWLFNGKTWPQRERRGCLVFAGNMSKPFRAAVLELMERGYPCLIWEPDPIPGSGFGLDALEGPADNVAQRLIKMQPVSSGNTGLRSGAVEGMLVDTVYTIDRGNKPRNFANILKYIRTVGVRDLDENGVPVGEPRELTRNEKAGLEDWCTRFSTLRRRLGACIGSDVKLSEVLAKGYVVFVQGSSYNNPNSINELTNLFVYYVMWLVGTVGNFDFIVDEPGAVEKDTFTRLLTATRAQGVRIMICPQSLEQVDKKLREMCTTVLLLGMAAGSPEAGELASDIVHKDIDPVDFTLLNPRTWRDNVSFWRPRRGLVSCTGYLLNNGRLDKVKTKYCDPDPIIARWPKGSIPKLPVSPSFEDEMEELEKIDGTTAPNTAVTTPKAEAVQASRKEETLHEVAPFEEFNAEARWYQVWLLLGKPTSKDVCWLVPETMVQSGGWASISVNGKKLYAPDVYRKFGEPNGKLEKKGPGKKYQLDHDCHTKDPSCDGGTKCKHRLCINPFQKIPCTAAENMARQKMQQLEHQAWLEKAA